MSRAAGPVVVIGLPRSATSWVANVLAVGASFPLVHEPDNEKEFVAALVAKRSLGRFPVLRPGAVEPAYEALWRAALAGPSTSHGLRARVASRLWRDEPMPSRERALSGHPSVRSRVAAGLVGPSSGADGADPAAPVDVVVKSVHAVLAIEWVASAFPAAQVVVVLRHPGNVLASWRSMSLPDQDRGLDRSLAVREAYLERWGIRPPGDEPVARAAWQVGLLTAALIEAAERHAAWTVVEHEVLCQDPAARFAAVTAELGLDFQPAGEAFLRTSNREGTGFAIQRRASELPDKWRSRLDHEALSALAAAVDQFPGLERWAPDLRTATGRRGVG